MEEVAEDSTALTPQYNRLNDNSSITTTNLACSVLEQEQLEDKIDKLYKDSGGFGKFQLFAMIALILGTDAHDLWFQELGYFTQAPDSYVCTYAREDN